MMTTCRFDIYLPINEIKDNRSKREYTALHRAEELWLASIEMHPELGALFQRDSFLAMQKGIRAEYMKSTISIQDSLFGIPSRDHQPVVEINWRRPRRTATFKRFNRKLFVNPNIPLVKDDIVPSFNGEAPATIPVTRTYEYQFPWFAEVGFNEAVKSCNKPSDKGVAYLQWYLPVDKVITNLMEVINIYENAPISGPAKEWVWIGDGLRDLKSLHRWLQEVLEYSSNAMAVLDWSGAAVTYMTSAEARKNNNPNEYMASARKAQERFDMVVKGQMTQDEINDLYARRDRSNEWSQIHSRSIKRSMAKAKAQREAKK